MLICVCECLRSGNALYKSTAPSRVYHEGMSRHSLTRKYFASFSYVCLLDPFHLPKSKKKYEQRFFFRRQVLQHSQNIFHPLGVLYHIMLYSLFNVLFVVQTFAQFSFPGTSNAHTHTNK